jgi:hypothetical protein
VLDLPQIVIPAMLRDAIVCGLATAAAWHGLSILQLWLKRNDAPPEY